MISTMAMVLPRDKARAHGCMLCLDAVLQRTADHAPCTLPDSLPCGDAYPATISLAGPLPTLSKPLNSLHLCSGALPSPAAHITDCSTVHHRRHQVVQPSA